MRIGTVGGTQPARSRSSVPLRGESSKGWPMPCHCMQRTMRTAKMVAGPLTRGVERTHFPVEERRASNGFKRPIMSRRLAPFRGGVNEGDAWKRAIANYRLAG